MASVGVGVAGTAVDGFLAARGLRTVALGSEDFFGIMMDRWEQHRDHATRSRRRPTPRFCGATFDQIDAEPERAQTRSSERGWRPTNLSSPVANDPTE